MWKGSVKALQNIYIFWELFSGSGFESLMWLCLMLHTHHEHLLHFVNALAKYGAELVSYTGQKEAKQRYP